MTTHRSQSRGRLLRRRRAFGGAGPDAAGLAEPTGLAEPSGLGEPTEPSPSEAPDAAAPAGPPGPGETGEPPETSEPPGTYGPAETSGPAEAVVAAETARPRIVLPVAAAAAAVFVVSAPRLLAARLGPREAGRRDAAPRQAQGPTRRRRAWLAIAGAAATWSMASVTLFVVYLHAAGTAAITSDGASNVLQAWDMLHHNLLLRGWQLSDVSFYTTELPQYLLIERLRGLGPDVVHIASAMTYTLLVLLAALLAKGRAKGRDGMIRAMIAAGIMLAPQPGDGIYVLLGSPDHAGSTVPVLAAFVLLDRAGRRWFAPLAAGALLSLTVLADGIAIFTAVGPVLAVCLVRIYQARFRAAWRWRRSWFEAQLACAAVAAVCAARVAQAAITMHGGFALWPISTMLVPAAGVPHSLLVTGHGLLLVFGANFLGANLGMSAALAVAHLAGLALAVWATCAAVRRFGQADLCAQLLAAGIVITLAAFLLGTRADDLLSARDIAAVLPFGAALAGRMLAARLARASLLPALLLALAGYLVSLGQLAAGPAASQPDATLAAWLTAHHLRYGLTDYWNADVMTVQTGGRVRLRAVTGDGSHIASGYWEARSGWYDPAAHDARFVVIAPGLAGSGSYPTIASVRQAFGQPARIYDLDSYTIMVWDKNLLADLVRGPSAPAAPPAVAPGEWLP